MVRTFCKQARRTMSAPMLSGRNQAIESCHTEQTALAIARRGRQAIFWPSVACLCNDWRWTDNQPMPFRRGGEMSERWAGAT